MEDINNISIDTYLLDNLINFNVLGRYLASIEMKANIKREFSDDNIFDSPFDEAIKEMKKRKPTLYENIKDVEQKEKQNYFWIKKTTDLEVAKRIHEKLLKNLKQGKSVNDFIKDVKDFELPKSYLKGVYRTVTTQAQQRGHLEQQLKAVDLGFEYGMFDGIDDDRQTHICNSLNGKVMKIKDFVDKGLYPPLHYQCRSSIIQLDKDDLEYMGLSVSDIPAQQEPFSDFTSDWDKKYKELYKKKEKETKAIKKQVKASIDKLQDKGYNNKKHIEYVVADEKIEDQLNINSEKIWYKELTQDERTALYDYTQSDYAKFNRYLRNALEEDDIMYEEDFEAIKNIKKVLSKYTLNHNLILRRGINKEEFEYIKNSDTFNTYKSCTIRQDIPHGFRKGYELIIKANNNTKGFYIGQFSKYENEKEFLINKGVKYKIINISDNILEVEIL
ncbi:ADP-ribosyltransferase [Caviibacter abscessus]|uniref:ADP-ribosyltransferase n=1 Tax=Caviibacter abscessus TaxID=1766719 RepID=UPI00083970C7|nr:ADP-ribosyltransferase [Caviibacter abscessus]